MAVARGPFGSRRGAAPYVDARVPGLFCERRHELLLDEGDQILDGEVDVKLSVRRARPAVVSHTERAPCAVVE
eukprot:7053036-Prymnesium_polylepis.2